MAGAALLRVTETSGLPFASALSTALSLLPDGDLAGIGGLGISDMRAWSAAKADEYHRRILTFNAIQNILVPIHRLPPDILSRIFVEAWKDRKSLRLTHVCRLWRTLLLETSEFWAVAIAGDEFRLPSDGEVSDEDYLDAVCLRSTPRNISLHLSCMSHRAKSKLIQFTDRITSMQIITHTRDQLELLWEVLRTGMPRLESLIIRGYPLMRAMKPVGFSTESLPVLTRLTLPVQMFFHSFHPTRAFWPSTLRELAILSNDEDFQYGLDPPFGIQRTGLLKVLSYYPTLTVLDIQIQDDMLTDVLFNGQHSPPSSLAFPALRLLRIGSPPDMLSRMLPLLTFPSSTYIDIKVARWPHPGEGDLFMPGCVLDAAVVLTNEVAIENDPTSTGVRGYADGVERFRIRVMSDRRDRPQIERLLSLFARTNAPVSRLLLTLHHEDPLLHVTFTGKNTFPAFSHLTHLALRGRNIVCTKFLADLCPLSESESVMPLLPLLKDLTVGVMIKISYYSVINKEIRQVIADVARLRENGEALTHFRKCCKLLPRVVDARAARGYRLSRLEFFSYADGCPAKLQVVPQVDLAALAPDSVERELEPLRRFVDGPVMFSGYRLVTSA